MSRFVSWVNPTQNTDGTAFPTTEIAGYEIGFDGAAAVNVPIGAATKYDVEQLAAYQALKSGNHTIELAVVAKSGGVSVPTVTSFPVKAIPRPCTSVAMA